MKMSPVYFVAGLTFLVLCLAFFTKSPAWAHMRTNDFLALVGAGISLAVMGIWVGVRSVPKQRP